MSIKLYLVITTVLLVPILAEFVGKHSGVVAISVTVNPPNVTTHTGENVILDCIYSDSVNCVWKKNAKVVKIIGRYKYLHAGTNGRNTRNCSIAITSVENIDNATWQCSMEFSLKQKFVALAQSFLGKITVIQSSQLVLGASQTTIAGFTASTMESESSDQDRRIEESAIFQCPKNVPIISETILITVTIGTTIIAILLLAIVICICLQKRNENGITNESLHHDRLSYSSDYDDTDNLLHVLPTLPELQRIESFRRSTLSSKTRAKNSYWDSKIIHYAEINNDGFLVLKPLRNPSFASRISRNSNSVPNLVRNQCNEDMNGYLNPKLVINPSDERVVSSISCQMKNPYGHIQKLGDQSEPIYLEVK